MISERVAHIVCMYTYIICTCTVQVERYLFLHIIIIMITKQGNSGNCTQ